ncbi:hypothetical protein QF040_004518 [Variovorax sp. W2I14]
MGGLADLQREQAHLLALPLAQFADGAPGPGREPAFGQEFTRPLARRLPGFAARGEAERELLGHGGKDDLVVGVLEHQPHVLRELAAVGLRPLRVAAMHHDAPLLRLVEPADEAEQAALARAVVAHEADARFIEAERQPVENALFTANQRDRFEADAVRDVGVGRGRLRQGVATVPQALPVVFLRTCRKKAR